MKFGWNEIILKMSEEFVNLFPSLMRNTATNPVTLIVKVCYYNHHSDLYESLQLYPAD
jgi:hypothetical protein